MCIISGARDAYVFVTATYIFIARILVGGGVEQLTVYQNTVQSDAYVAMILPVPGLPTMVDMSGFEDFMDGVAQQFDMLKPPSIWRSDTPMFFGADPSSEATPLPIVRVGSYDTTVAASVADLSRVQWGAYELSDQAAGVLATYPPDYSFVVCKLRDGERPHPVAFRHAVDVTTPIYVPLRHGGHGNEDKDAEPDFDHKIYILDKDLDFDTEELSALEVEGVKQPFRKVDRWSLMSLLQSIGCPLSYDESVHGGRDATLYHFKLATLTLPLSVGKLQPWPNEDMFIHPRGAIA